MGADAGGRVAAVISNEAVQRLIATDRDALIALLALAMECSKAGGERTFNTQYDPDIQALLAAAWNQNAPPDPWLLLNGRWRKRP